MNNAGYTWDGVVHKMSAKQWEAMLAVHCTAPFRIIQASDACTLLPLPPPAPPSTPLHPPLQALAPLMRDPAKAEAEASGSARPRCILNVSSVSGTHGAAGQANYATAKAGVVGLTKSVAREWGHLNIRCNALAYGYINTR